MIDFNVLHVPRSVCRSRCVASSHQYAGGIRRSLDILSLRLHFYLFILRAGFYTLRVESREDGGTFYGWHKTALFFCSLLLECSSPFAWAMTSSGPHRPPTWRRVARIRVYIYKLLNWYIDKLGEMDMIKLRMNDVVDNENNDIDIDPVLLALTQWMMTDDGTVRWLKVRATSFVSVILSQYKYRYYR